MEKAKESISCNRYSKFIFMIAALLIIPLSSTLLFSAGVGEPAPDFSVVDVHGKSIKLVDYRDKKHVIVVFYLFHS